MAWSVLGLGSNLGNRMDFLQQALEEVQSQFSILAASPVYETEPWGVGDQQPYLNTAIFIAGDFSPFSLLAHTQAWEQRLGRMTKGDYQPRTVDIDILYIEQICMEEPGLTLPHPRITERQFVLVPLLDLIPDFMEPRSNQTIRYLAQICSDRSWIRKVGHLNLPKTIAANREIE